MDFTYEEVSRIVEQSKNDLINNPQFRLFSERYIQKIWEKRVNKKAYFCIYISSDNFQKIDFAQLAINIDMINDSVAENNFLRIDSLGIVVEKCYKDLNTEKMQDELCQISKENLAFFIGEDGVTFYANGVQVNYANIFYSRQDRIKYLEKKDISKIEDVIREYTRSYVSQQVFYMSFMADKSTLLRMENGTKYINRNILRNKPEHYMRDQLRQYLNEHMQYTFTIEPELGQTKRELDIYFDVKGELYFIEIKWLGACINDDGTGLSSTTYGEPRAKEGVVQCLEYIEELVNTSEASLRCGYLAIFDARDLKTEIDFGDYSFVKPELKDFLQLFKLLPIIEIQKRHAA